jgi:sugar lactone lactonase YvrE
LDSAGNLYIADQGTDLIRMVNAQTGVITTVAGIPPATPNGQPNSGYSGDGGPATSAKLYMPYAVTVDGAGNLYIADTYNQAIRKVTASTGIISTVAGAGNADVCYSLGGDGGPATSAALCYPQGVTVDGAGNLYISDSSESRIREATVAGPPPTAVAAAPVFSVPAGTYVGTQTVTLTDSTPGAAIYLTMDGSTPSTLSPMYNGPIGVTGAATIQAVAVAPGYLASTLVTAAYTITTPPTAVISTVAGNGIYGFSGNGGPATSAAISFPDFVTLDGAGNLYFSDTQNEVVWMVAARTGAITIVAGNGTFGYSGDNGPATNAQLEFPNGVAVDSAGNLYIADSEDDLIRKVTAATGVITTIVGTYRQAGYGVQFGDGGPASAAYLYNPAGLALDSAGNLYIADSDHDVVRKISASSGIITTVAGINGQYSYGGDGGPATSAGVGNPYALAFDSVGNLYIAAPYEGRIRKVAASTGVITTVAGNGDPSGNSGDGGLATNAEISPYGIAVDAAGNLYISNPAGAVREVAANTGIITRVVGNGYWGYSGDGGAATMAELDGPHGLAFDAAGNLYVADAANFRVRKVTFPGPAATPSIGLAAGTYVGTQSVAITDSMQGATIYYTTDGSTPATGSSVYSGPVTVSATETLQAIAVVTGYTESAVASAIYTINQSVTPTITWPTPAAITYGTALSAAQLNASSSVAGNFVYTPAVGTVLTAGSQTLSVTFTPTDAIDYTTATATVIILVNPAASTITWATPAAIPYGTALSAAQLNATSSVPGSFVYTPAAGTVLTAGSQTLSVTFTPTDATDYTTATTSLTLTVSKAAPPITWATPAAVTYGTALSATQLNATSSVPGSFVYTPAAGTMLTAGSQTLSVTFTPTDTTDYAMATISVTLTVSKAAPPITWATPAAVTYGTALSATQLNASSSVAGSFVYTPAAGTVLTAGSQTLSVTFTPTDATDYTTATSGVTLTVSKVAPAITWATPAAIPYGAALSAAQLNATSNVAGSFVYTPAAGTVLTAGSQTLSVTFTPTDTTDYSTATTSVKLAVNKVAPAVGVNLSSSNITMTQALTVTVAVSGASGASTPTGSVKLAGGSYSAQQTLAAGSTTFNLAAGTLPVGSYTLTATYTPDSASAGNYASASQTAPLTVTPPSGAQTPTVTVTATAATITNQQSDTVTVSVAGSSGQPTPTGTLTLASGSYNAQQTLTSGSASFTIAAGTLSSGANALTASYSGDANYGAASRTASVTVAQAVIALAAPASIIPGASGTSTGTISAGSTYSGTLDLTCSLTGSPTGAVSLPTCGLSPTTVTVTSGGNATAVFTVNTTAASTTALNRPAGSNLWRFGGGGAVLAAFLIFGIPSRRRRWITMAALLMAFIVVGATGCGGNGSSKTSTSIPATTAGNYTFTITGTDSVSAKITTSTNVTVTVQ